MSLTRKKPNASQLQDLEFAWRLVRFFRSNAIVIVRDQQLLGAGSGQTSRVFAVEVALLKAENCGHALAGSALASDAFFPFRDGIDKAAAGGITAIVQPGGQNATPKSRPPPMNTGSPCSPRVAAAFVTNLFSR